MSTRIGRTVVSLAMGLAVGACGGGARSGVGTSQGPVSASAAEIEALYQARVDSARMRFTEADARFMTHMIHHHAQALVMARLAPTRGASPQVQTLAARIINGQSDEIATMQRWLRDRDQPVPAVDAASADAASADAAHGAMAHDDHAAGMSMAMQMPGMLTPEQMRSLEEARGPQFDRLFLTLMIQHHNGAVEMVKELFSTDGAGQDEEVFKFASDAQVDQATEIARMESMLARLPGGAP